MVLYLRTYLSGGLLDHKGLAEHTPVYRHCTLFSVFRFTITEYVLLGCYCNLLLVFGDMILKSEVVCMGKKRQPVREGNVNAHINVGIGRAT